MSTANELSITLSPELAARAQLAAKREQRTVNEIVLEALTSYLGQSEMAMSARWQKIFEYGHTKGRELGITCEEDVDRILGEFRTESLN